MKDVILIVYLVGMMGVLGCDGFANLRWPAVSVCTHRRASATTVALSTPTTFDIKHLFQSSAVKKVVSFVKLYFSGPTRPLSRLEGSFVERIMKSGWRTQTIFGNFSACTASYQDALLTQPELARQFSMRMWSEAWGANVQGYPGGSSCLPCLFTVMHTSPVCVQ